MPVTIARLIAQANLCGISTPFEERDAIAALVYAYERMNDALVAMCDATIEAYFDTRS